MEETELHSGFALGRTLGSVGANYVTVVHFLFSLRGELAFLGVPHLRRHFSLYFLLWEIFGGLALSLQVVLEALPGTLLEVGDSCYIVTFKLNVLLFKFDVS